jgi:hypothetical protein
VQNNDHDFPHNLSISGLITIKIEMTLASCLVSREIMGTICLADWIRVKRLALP